MKHLIISAPRGKGKTWTSRAIADTHEKSTRMSWSHLLIATFELSRFKPIHPFSLVVVEECTKEGILMALKAIRACNDYDIIFVFETNDEVSITEVSGLCNVLNLNNSHV